MSYRFIVAFGVVLLCALSAAWAAEPQYYSVDWRIELKAGKDLAKITLEIADGRPVRELRFSFDPERLSDFKARGDLHVEGRKLVWRPSKTNARLSYKVRISRERVSKNSEQSYDALMTDDWAIFRGDRLIPAISVRSRKGFVAKTLLHFDLPKRWEVNTGWERYKEFGPSDSFIVDDQDRRFDRPTGWMMAGKLGSRRDIFGSTYVSVSAPKNSETDRMGWLSLIGLTYSEAQKAFGHMPAKILIVSADDPLWRGGLSGPNSLYFHSSRRAISENGSSPLLHEITHLVTRIRGADNDDWIAEGLAEFYGIELLHRAGGLSTEKRAQVLARLQGWGENEKCLRKTHSSGPTTARAVIIFEALDKEIQAASKHSKNIDDLTRALMKKREISFEDLRKAAKGLIGNESKILQEKILLCELKK